MLKKIYPNQYDKAVRAVLELMSISGHPLLVGSSSDRQVLYSADFDGWDECEYTTQSTKIFKNSIKSIESLKSLRVGDIKVGQVVD